MPTKVYNQVEQVNINFYRTGRNMTIAKSILLAVALSFPLTAQADSPMDQCRSFFLHGQYDLAIAPCIRAAEQGNVNAQNWLGLQYFKGKGVVVDYGQAFKWRRMAAEQGNRVGQFTLGRMYEQGMGVARDYQAANSWYRKAAAQGSSDAQYSLGGLYKEGRGVSKDLVKAYIWYSLATNQGMYLAKVTRDQLKNELTPEQLQRAEHTVDQSKAGSLKAD